MVDAREPGRMLSLARLGAARPLDGEGDGLWKLSLERVWSLGASRFMVKWAELDEAELLNKTQVTMLRRTAEGGHLPGLDDVSGLLEQGEPAVAAAVASAEADATAELSTPAAAAAAPAATPVAATAAAAAAAAPAAPAAPAVPAALTSAPGAVPAPAPAPAAAPAAVAPAAAHADADAGAPAAAEAVSPEAPPRAVARPHWRQPAPAAAVVPATAVAPAAIAAPAFAAAPAASAAAIPTAPVAAGDGDGEGGANRPNAGTDACDVALSPANVEAEVAEAAGDEAEDTAQGVHAAAAAAVEVTEEVQKLVVMGFGIEQARAALEAAAGDSAVAVAYLLGDD